MLASSVCCEKTGALQKHKNNIKANNFIAIDFIPNRGSDLSFHSRPTLPAEWGINIFYPAIRARLDSRSLHPRYRWIVVFYLLLKKATHPRKPPWNWKVPVAYPDRSKRPLRRHHSSRARPGWEHRCHSLGLLQKAHRYATASNHRGEALRTPAQRPVRA